jgi:hypothetical protein
MIIKAGIFYINTDNITHMLAQDDVLTIYLIGGQSVPLTGEDSAQFFAELRSAGLYKYNRFLHNDDKFSTRDASS